tara:strand:- start:132102 stop:135716 length:3615 start_codon:yes stop_codon:yes gene_type:complete
MKPTSLIRMLSLFLLTSTTSVIAQRPPNVVLIFADDLGYGDVGCYGATKVQTPNIDKLAAEGRRFTDAHSVSAVCTPSRYALLTGQYPVRANGGRGVWGPAPVTSPLIVDTEKTTIADVFKRSGYDTAVIGKWHLGFGQGTNQWQEPLRPGPQDLGFDYYFGMPVVNSAPPYVFVENDRIVGSDPDDPLIYLGRKAKDVTPITPIPPEAAQRSPNQFGGATVAHDRFNDYQVGTTLAEKSVQWINTRKDNPFFLYLATTNIHHPFTPAKRFQGTSQCGLYGDFIHELDWMVGEILSCLDDNGLSDNTLVIFTSDNGGMFNHGGQAAFKAGHRQNGDLLGFKFGVWEGGHRVPLIVRWPGKVKAGTTSNQLIGNVDMLATFAALTQQKLDRTQQADSVNMLPALVGQPEQPIRDHLVLAPHKGTHLSIRKGNWMFIPGRGSGGFGGKKPGDHTFAGPAAASFVGSVNSDIEDGQIKQDAPTAQLYDLAADVNQTENVHNEHPEVVKQLTSLLASFKPKPSEAKASPNARAGNRRPRSPSRPAKKSAARPSPRSASFDFESGKLAPWKMVEGKFAHVIGSRTKFFRNERDYNKQGTYYLTTLEPSPNAEKGMDAQTGVIVSPLFVPKGGSMTFRIGGGSGDATYAALCTADGKEVRFARGINDQVMQESTWDLSPYVGKTMFIKIVDRATGGWGHITVDDFQFDGEVLLQLPDAKSTGQHQSGLTQSNATAATTAAAGAAGASDGRQPDSSKKTIRLANKAPQREPGSKPNFIVIFADDLGFGDISCYAPTGVKTPHLDTLAAEGFRSTDFFVPANVCSPSRAALLTGRYPMRCGMPVARNENIAKYRNYGFASEELTIPELLRTAGYRSLMVGKWHLGLEIDGSHPIDAGFDDHLGIPSNYESKRGKNHNTLYRGRRIEQAKVRCEELTRLYTDEVVDFIGRQKDDPFFIYVSHHIVHSPLLPSKDFIGTSAKGVYGDFIKELDHSTGRIMKAIRDAGLDQNTLVVFTSDNGPNRAGSTGGLAGGKYCTMEGGHRVPGIFRWPSKIPAGQVSGTTLSSMDLLPLFCSLAGVGLPQDRKIDGKNIFQILRGEQNATPHEILYYYNGTNLQAVREGNWKLHLPRVPKDQPFWSKVPSHTWKGFVTLKDFRLFDLDNDVGEQRNVADQHPEIVARLKEHAENVRAELGDVATVGTDQREIHLVDPQER